jgi:hypothetical protein
MCRPSETFLQNDLDRAVEYRKEYYKYVIGIATALLAFTVSFPPQLSRPAEMSWLLFMGWGGLGVAVLAGVRVHMTWAKFFVSFRDYDNKEQRTKGVEVRKHLNNERRVMDVLQMISLVVGVACVVVFAGINVKYIAPRNEATVNPIETATHSRATKAVEERPGDANPIAPALLPSSKIDQ